MNLFDKIKKEVTPQKTNYKKAAVEHLNRAAEMRIKGDYISCKRNILIARGLRKIGKNKT